MLGGTSCKHFPPLSPFFPYDPWFSSYFRVVFSSSLSHVMCVHLRDCASVCACFFFNILTLYSPLIGILPRNSVHISKGPFLQSFSFGSKTMYL